MRITLDAEVEEVWREFWQPIVCDADGNVDMDLIKCELYDFHIVMDEVRKVYDHVTYGMVSKPNTKAEVVISLIEENYS